MPDFGTSKAMPGIFACTAFTRVATTKHREDVTKQSTMKRSINVKVTALAFAGALTMTSGLAVAQQAPPVDLGDLIILYRDANGVPFLTPAVGDTGLCQQPIAFNFSDPADPADLCPQDCVVDSVPTGADVVAVDQTTCAVVVGCEACTQEVNFGRINEARSPDSVFDSQLQDVVVNLATSDCVVTLDPAGRMVTGTIAADGAVTTSAIDSPLQNLAIYRQLIQTGSLGVPLPQEADVLDTAARGLGAASDKAGEVNEDLVAYLNQIMGLSDPATTTILDPKICIQVREEVQGVVQLVQKCFLDYGAYAYDREANFLALPAPPYIPADLPQSGWFEHLALVPETDPPLFQIAQGPILDAVFPDTPFVGFVGDNIGAFAQASDDARAVIDFMHNWPVPAAADFETPVPCEALADITYDVSISPVSGLQVPRNIVSGTEGREFTVTVANAGPDPATGTVTVTAEIATGGVVPGSPWVFTFTDLQAGLSASFTQIFTVTVPQATTISWTAIVEAPFDVVTSNNVVTATSNVRVTGRQR